jgi:phospholipase C
LPIPQTVGEVPFATTGVRVPAFVISPQVAPGRIFSANLDHTAILQLLDDKFGAGEGYTFRPTQTFTGPSSPTPPR